MKKLLIVLGAIAIAVMCMAGTGQPRGSNPLVVHLTLTNAGTEYCYTVPDTGVHGIAVNAFGTGELKLDFVADGAGTVYYNILTGTSLILENIYLAPGQSICMQSGTAGKVAQMIVGR